MKTLIVVDVQREFGSCITIDYLKELQEHIATEFYDKIITVVDCNMGEAYIPNFLEVTQDELLFKHYGTDTLDYYIEDDDYETEVIEEDRVLRLTGNDSLLITTHGSHVTFEIDSEMQSSFKRLKRLGGDVTVVGGARGECLTDITCALDYFEVEYSVKNSLTYSGYDMGSPNTTEGEEGIIMFCESQEELEDMEHKGLYWGSNIF